MGYRTRFVQVLFVGIAIYPSSIDLCGHYLDSILLEPSTVIIPRKGRSRLAYMSYDQSGLCPVCNAERLSRHELGTFSGRYCPPPKCVSRPLWLSHKCTKCPSRNQTCIVLTRQNVTPKNIESILHNGASREYFRCVTRLGTASVCNPNDRFHARNTRLSVDTSSGEEGSVLTPLVQCTVPFD